MSEFNPETFDVAVPWEDIPESDVVDEGRYVLRVREVKLAESKEGKLLAVGFYMIEEGPLSGVAFPIQNYTLGTVDDPMCDQDPKTWRTSFGARQLNQLLAACNVVKDGRSLAVTLKRLTGTRFQGYVTKSVQKTGEYAGQEQNRITRVAAYGTEMRVPGHQKMAVPGAANGEGPRKRQRPVIEDEVAEEPQREQVDGEVRTVLETEGEEDIPF